MNEGCVECREIEHTQYGLDAPNKWQIKQGKRVMIRCSLIIEGQRQLKALPLSERSEPYANGVAFNQKTDKTKHKIMDMFRSSKRETSKQFL